MSAKRNAVSLAAIKRLKRLRVVSEMPENDASDVGDRYHVALFTAAPDLFDLAEEALRLRPRVAATVELAKQSGYGLFANILTGKQTLNRRRR